MISNPNIFPDSNYYRQTGTSPLECWYNPTNITSVGATVTTFPIDKILAWAFISGSGNLVNKIAVNVTSLTTAGDKGRIGIYTSTSQANLYPDELIADSGELDFSTTGVKSVTINKKLIPNQVYWAAYIGGGSTINLRTPGTTGVNTLLGNSPSSFTVFNYGISATLSYAALPATFTSGAAFDTLRCPVNMLFTS